VKVTGKLAGDLITYVGGVYVFNEWDETHLNEFLRFGTSLHATPADRADLFNEFLRNGTQSEAAYLQTDFHILPNLTLTTGIRYTHDRKEVEVNTTDPAAGNAAIYQTSQIAGQPVLSTYHFTPKVALTYQVTPDFMVYGSYIDGFKSGGWNGRASTAAQFTSFGNEKAQSWELGWRSELFDKRLRFNGTFFWVNYNDLQLASGYVAPDGENTEIFTNAGNSQVRGMQLESVAAVTDNLSVNASLGMEEAKFTELAAGVSITGLTLKSPVPFSPPLTWNIGATYNTDDVDWARGSFTMTGTFQYIPDYNTGAGTTSTDSPVSTVLNASITYHPAASRWSVGAECTNCLFRYFPIQAGSFDYVSLPGYAGVRVRYEM
jgi:iron complex outermembrane receptor protein